MHLAARDTAPDVRHEGGRDLFEAEQHHVPVPQAARIVVVVWTAVLPQDGALRIDFDEDAAPIVGPHGKEAQILGTLTPVKQVEMSHRC